MKIIVGLGNPGKEYEKTRHNSGFFTIDKLLDKLNIKLDRENRNALYTIYHHNGEKVFIIKPLTYMNLSGEAVREIIDYYCLDPKDLIVVHDDLDLPVGKIRLREKGSSGGQKGMGNIIKLLGSEEIKRIRIGIAKDKNIDVKDYVLGKVSKEEWPTYEDSINRAADALVYALDEDNFEIVMSKYNVK